MAEPGKTHGLDELNLMLGRGWRVVTVTSMGGAGVYADHNASSQFFAALVVLEFSGELTAEFMEQVQQPEEIPEKAGDGFDIGEGDFDIGEGDA